MAVPFLSVFRVNATNSWMDDVLVKFGPSMKLVA